MPVMRGETCIPNTHLAVKAGKIFNSDAQETYCEQAACQPCQFMSIMGTSTDSRSKSNCQLLSEQIPKQPVVGLSIIHPLLIGVKMENLSRSEVHEVGKSKRK